MTPGVFRAIRLHYGYQRTSSWPLECLQKFTALHYCENSLSTYTLVGSVGRKALAGACPGAPARAQGTASGRGSRELASIGLRALGEAWGASFSLNEMSAIVCHMLSLGLGGKRLPGSRFRSGGPPQAWGSRELASIGLRALGEAWGAS